MAWSAARMPRAAWLLGGLGLVPFVYYGAQHDRVDTRAAPRLDAVVEAAIRTAAAVSIRDVGVDAAIVETAAAWAKDAALARDQATVRRRFVTYGASILAFMGGAQWGMAVAAPVPVRSAQYALSVLPALAGWAVLNMDTTSTSGSASAWGDVAPHAVLGVGFLGVYAYDRVVVRAGRGPGWYLRLRTPLTTVVLLSTAGAALLSRALPAPPVQP